MQISDLHLGLILNSGFLRDVVREVNAQRPDAVLITGDLFEGEDRSLDRFVGPLNALSAPRGVYFVTGNHETYLGVDRALAALAKTKVRALNDEMETVEGLQIIGISYPLRGFSKDIAGIIGRLPGFDRDKPSLLLYHSPTQIAEVKSAGVNLQVSGTHPPRADVPDHAHHPADLRPLRPRPERGWRFRCLHLHRHGHLGPADAHGKPSGDHGHSA